jgi:hypothetical protein
MPSIPPKAYLSWPRDPTPSDDLKGFGRRAAGTGYGDRGYKKVGVENRAESLSD